MISEQTIIRPCEPGAKATAIQVAAACYRKWMGAVSFSDDLAYYLTTGCVVARPTCFAMAKIIDVAPLDAEGNPIPPKQHAWFIRVAVGNLGELLSCIPCYLPKIAFCRRGDKRMRIYKLERLLRFADKPEEKRRRKRG